VKIAYDPQPMPRHVAGLADVKSTYVRCISQIQHLFTAPV
jgi:deoxycytidine triphosphate deaminase